MSNSAVPKRSRKKIIELSSNKSIIEEIVAAAAAASEPAPSEDNTTKKSRGRKSKVLAANTSGATGNTDSTHHPGNSSAVAANIILQLKCCLKDLREYNSQYNNCMTNPTEYNPAVPPSIMTYNEDTHASYCLYDKSGSSAENTSGAKDTVEENIVPEFICSRCCGSGDNCNIAATNANTTNNTNTTKSSVIQQKVKKLKLQLYKSVSEGPGKQAACFWCTYDFDTPACYIPKYETEDAIHAYGSFCTPNCAAAYLLNENINDSIRFERYALLNWVYSSDDTSATTNIHPAPNPYYTLQKFYGNLSIQEYRRLTQSDNHHLIVLERPLTRILPELHEESNATRMQPNVDETKMNMGMGGFRVRKESEKAMRASKSDIVRDRFGLASK